MKLVPWNLRTFKVLPGSKSGESFAVELDRSMAMIFWEDAVRRSEQQQKIPAKIQTGRTDKKDN